MSEYFLKEYPGKTDLISWYRQNKTDRIPEVNAHLHTPYSFSAFENTEQIFDMALHEGVSILGINDFFVADGYETFYQNSLRSKIFPLFNIEFIGLLTDEQQKNIRVNDPNNPGRTYLCGKGLKYPFNLEPGFESLLRNVRYKSQIHVEEMIEKASSILQQMDPKIFLRFCDVKRLFAKELVRERHVARAIKVVIFKRYHSDNDRISFLKKIYDGKDSKADIHDDTAVENEIRENLLKAGGRAFVPEGQEAFLQIHEIIGIILNAGGIPCYPVLLDDKNGNFTEYESDMQLLLNKLEKQNIFCVELIPGRNNLAGLKEFVHFFHENKFVITFGTEHNTPGLVPVMVTARGNQPLDPELKRISWEGASVIAAHQYLHAKGEEGYIKTDGTINRDNMCDYIELGKAVIEKFITM